LHRLTQQQLANVLFPLGEIPKTEVRDIAEKLAYIMLRKKILLAFVLSVKGHLENF
jgi:tRNA-specific 2-thiouridylase